jgi:hypothetical protein
MSTLKLDPEDLRRCEDCNWMLVRLSSERDLRAHLGHKWHSPVTHITLLEYALLWLGWL